MFLLIQNKSSCGSELQILKMKTHPQIFSTPNYHLTLVYKLVSKNVKWSDEYELEM